MAATGPDAAAADPACREARWRGGPLTAKSLRLRPFVADDVSALVALAGDAEIARRTTDIPHPYTPADARAFVAQSAQRIAEGTEYAFAVERIADGVAIGAVSLRRTDGDGDDTGEVGYWIGRPFWCKGYAVEALRRLVRFAFHDRGFATLAAGVMADNAASAKVLLKAGFVFAGESTGERGRCKDAKVKDFALARADWLKAEAEKPMLLVAAVAMVDVDGRVLMARRPEGKSMAGLWEFPGGKVDGAETPEAALVRELAEELGVDITESCLAPIAFASHAYDDFHLLMPLFACRVWKGTPAPREGQALKWVRPERLADLPMPPADVPLVALLRDLL